MSHEKRVEMMVEWVTKVHEVRCPCGVFFATFFCDADRRRTENCLLTVPGSRVRNMPTLIQSLGDMRMPRRGEGSGRSRSAYDSSIIVVQSFTGVVCGGGWLRATTGNGSSSLSPGRKPRVQHAAPETKCFVAVLSYPRVCVCVCVVADETATALEYAGGGMGFLVSSSKNPNAVLRENPPQAIIIVAYYFLVL